MGEGNTLFILYDKIQRILRTVVQCILGHPNILYAGLLQKELLWQNSLL